MRIHACLAFLVLAACGPTTSSSGTQAAALAGAEPSPDATTDGGTTSLRYADVDDYLLDGGDSAGFDSWLAVRDTLKSSFDDLCGDTYCGGDYPNLEPIRLRCSIDTTSGILKSCKYVFAGSYETVNPSTGSIKVTAKTFSCAVTVTNIKLTDFMSTITATGSTEAIQRPLSSSVRSVYDSLGGCL
jgi:hypothetical protein